MRPGPVKTLPCVFWLLVAGNALIFALIWLERTLAAMDSAPQLHSHQVPFLTEKSSLCVVLGPLDDYDAAAALAERIQGDGGRAIIRERDILSLPDYVVHVEPSASRDLAMRTLRELKNQAINGHVISDGKLANAVSVGVFGLLAPAEARRRRVAESRLRGGRGPLRAPPHRLFGVLGRTTSPEAERHSSGTVREELISGCLGLPDPLSFATRQLGIEFS